MIELSEHFGDDTRRDNSESTRRRKWFLKARQDKIRQMDVAEDAAETNLSTAVTLSIATDMQIEQFKDKLELYDAAVIEALEDNQEQLQIVRERLAQIEIRIRSMLDQAYVHDDGRRMFKSEDGSFVIDEQGNDVSLDQVDPNLIEGPTAEIYLKELNSLNSNLLHEQELLVEREQLHNTQDLIHEKQEALESGTSTTQDLEDYDNEVFDALPQSARDKLSDDMNPLANAPNLTSSFTSPSNPIAPAAPASAPIQQFGFDG